MLCNLLFDEYVLLALRRPPPKKQRRSPGGDRESDGLRARSPVCDRGPAPGRGRLPGEYRAGGREANLFHHLIDRQVLERLAEGSHPREKKQEVPVWFYLASQISLRLHGVPGYNTPYVLRTGGLIDALGPKISWRRDASEDTVGLQMHGNIPRKQAEPQVSILGVRLHIT